jgi:hypothetical protein
MKLSDNGIFVGRFLIADLTPIVIIDVFDFSIFYFFIIILVKLCISTNLSISWHTVIQNCFLWFFLFIYYQLWGLLFYL